MTDDLDCLKLADDIAIAWEQDAHIALVSERAGQRRGYFAKAAHFYVVGKFGGDEQDLGTAAWNGVGTERSPTSGFGRPPTSSRIMRLPPLSHPASPFDVKDHPPDRRSNSEIITGYGDHLSLKRRHLLVVMHLTADFVLDQTSFTKRQQHDVSIRRTRHEP